jgi:hypothetical protein
MTFETSPKEGKRKRCAASEVCDAHRFLCVGGAQLPRPTWRPRPRTWPSATSMPVEHERVISERRRIEGRHSQRKATRDGYARGPRLMRKSEVLVIELTKGQCVGKDDTSKSAHKRIKIRLLPFPFAATKTRTLASSQAGGVFGSTCEWVGGCGVTCAAACCGAQLTTVAKRMYRRDRSMTNCASGLSIFSSVGRLTYMALPCKQQCSVCIRVLRRVSKSNANVVHVATGRVAARQNAQQKGVEALRSIGYCIAPVRHTTRHVLQLCTRASVPKRGQHSLLQPRPPIVNHSCKQV